MRRCPRCGRTLPESDFYRMGNRLQGWCRECSRSYNREWRRDNPGKHFIALLCETYAQYLCKAYGIA